MTLSREKRLAKLERRRSPEPEVVIVWCDRTDTPEQAIARRFPKGVPPGTRPLTVRWLRPGEVPPAVR